MTSSPVPDLRREFPLHWAVYTNDVDDLRGLLENDEIDVNKRDPRGRTPLMLAVTLVHKACVDELIGKGADADSQNKEMWSVSNEAVATGDPELIRTIIKCRDYQRAVKYFTSMKTTLERMRDTPDFYAEMSWEFSSWVPFVSKMCPSDTYKIYKSGSTVRIDTTLVGFEASSWKRGNQTFIFRLTDLEAETVPQIVVIDHYARTATVQTLSRSENLEDFDVPEEAVSFRMTTPISTTYIDVDKIGFERSRGGFFSWISSGDRNETVDGYDCKVFNASNVDLVTKQRSEHLTEEDKNRFKQEESASPLSSVLNMVRSETTEPALSPVDALGGITATEYLDKDFDMQCDIGRPKQISRKSNTFKATLWLAEDYPLQLQEQVVPIVDMMASNSAHFARLNSFIRLQLPSGFPVKIEIPLFHVVSARITFGNINEPGPYVTPVNDMLAESGGLCSPVTIEDRVFEIPTGYRVLDDQSSTSWFDGGEDVRPASSHVQGRYHHAPSAEQQEEMLLQLAIQQSLMDANGRQEPGGSQREAETLGYANGVPRAMIDPIADQEAMELAVAIQESLRLSAGIDDVATEAVAPGVFPIAFPQEDGLTAALLLSRAEEERVRREQEEEEEELRRVLELSKQDM